MTHIGNCSDFSQSSLGYRSTKYAIIGLENE